MKPGAMVMKLRAIVMKPGAMVMKPTDGRAVNAFREGGSRLVAGPNASGSNRSLPVAAPGS